MRTALLAGIAGLALLSASAELAAQCASVRVTPYGTTCPYFAQPAALTASYDSARCVLSLRLSRSRTCCNTFARTQLLLFGATPIDPGIPHPILWPGCVLSVAPLVGLAQPVSAGGVFDVPIPPVGAPLTLYAQGVNEYFTTIGFTVDFQSSDALRIDVS